MEYEEAVKRWGYRKLIWWYSKEEALGWLSDSNREALRELTWQDVIVETYFDPGAHYGGTQDYSAVAEVAVSAKGLRYYIDFKAFDLGKFVSEVVAEA